MPQIQMKVKEEMQEQELNFSTNKCLELSWDRIILPLLSLPNIFELSVFNVYIAAGYFDLVYLRLKLETEKNPENENKDEKG